MRTEAALAGVEMLAEQLRAGPLHQHNHKTGRKYLWHLRDDRRFRKGVGYRLVLRHLVGEGMPEAGLECRLHDDTFLSGSPAGLLAAPSVLAFSSPDSTSFVPSHGERKSQLRNSCAN